MGKKIIGNTVGTNLNPEKLKKELDPTSAIEEALAEAKASGEFDGEDGKSAYAYATEGGYGKTEEEFYKDLGGINPAGGDIILSDSMPLMDGEASPGASGEVSRADHTHPPDITRMPAMSEMEEDAISDESKIPFEDHVSESMKYLTFRRLIELVNIASYYSHASDSVPLINGDASSGTSDKFSRADHVHPTDTSRMSADVGSFGAVEDFNDFCKFPIADKSNNLKSITWGKVLEAIINGIAPETAKAISDALENYYNKVQTEAYVQEHAQPKGDYAEKKDIPTIPVDSVNGKTGAVNLTASDVGARANTWTPTYSDVGADKSGTAASAVNTHDVASDAHNDIRLLIKELSDAVNHFLDIDDKTKDQASELIQLIEDNATQIETITNGKVNVSDIINNLNTNRADRPLSAAQGVALKALIDAITVPTKVSAFENDKGYLTGYTESDPTVPAWAKAANKPSYSKSEVGLGNVDNVKQYSASNPPPYPVTSVNGKTGAVSLDTITITGVDENGAAHTWTVYGVSV